MPITDMDGQDALVRQTREIQGKRFMRNQMVGHRIAAIGVDHQDIVEGVAVLMFALQHLAGIARYQIDRRGGLG